MAKNNYMKNNTYFGDGQYSSRSAEVVRKVGVDPRVYGTTNSTQPMRLKTFV